MKDCIWTLKPSSIGPSLATFGKTPSFLEHPSQLPRCLALGPLLLAGLATSHGGLHLGLFGLLHLGQGANELYVFCTVILVIVYINQESLGCTECIDIMASNIIKMRYTKEYPIRYPIWYPILEGPPFTETATKAPRNLVGAHGEGGHRVTPRTAR